MQIFGIAVPRVACSGALKSQFEVQGDRYDRYAFPLPGDSICPQGQPTSKYILEANANGLGG